MQTLDALKTQFERPGIAVEAGNGGLPRITVTTPSGMAEIYLVGACITRYQSQSGAEVLFCSETSKFAPGKAIRGGIPIVFPWFGPHPSDSKQPQHGFARTADWTLEETRQNPDGTASVVLALHSSPETLAAWSFDFALRYTVTVSNHLEAALEVTNTGGQAFTFEDALHTYLQVGSIHKTEVTGLDGRTYIDKVDGAKRKTEDASQVLLTGETDRVYLDTPGPHTVLESENGTIHVEKEGSACTVVWNPWETKAEAMADLAGGQWSHFVCVEAANAAEAAVTLAPGQSHTLRTRLHRE